MGAAGVLVTMAMTIVTYLMARSTRKAANSTRDMAESTRDMVADTKTHNEFGQKVERVHVLMELLSLFEEKVITRSIHYERNNKDLLYSGPTGPYTSDNEPFHHPEFLSRTNVDDDVVRVLNGLEQFAAAVEASIQTGIFEDITLGLVGRPTAETFIETVNNYYDVLCVFRAKSLSIYSAVVALYLRWEPDVIAYSIENREHLQEIHDYSPTFKGYRMGCDPDFTDYFPTERLSPTLYRSWTWEGSGSKFLWIQAVNKKGEGISGYPMRIRLCGVPWAKVVTYKTSKNQVCEAQTFESERPLYVLGNSSGTVILNLENGDSGGEASVKIINPLDATESL